MTEPSLVEFVVAALIVLLIPGPGVIYVVARSLAHGRIAGLVSVLGLSAGILIQVAAVAAGLSAILAASATAFGVVKLLGAAYLVFLGLRALAARRGRHRSNPPLPPASRRVFVEGLLVSVTNPKSAVFFLAFLPQFVSPAAGMVAGQILALGAVYAALAIVTDGCYALFADWFRERLARWTLPGYAEGAVYIGLGAGLALAERKP